jgi:ribosomal protein S18 acetylase RimI-like enzyme
MTQLLASKQNRSSEKFIINITINFAAFLIYILIVNIMIKIRKIKSRDIPAAYKIITQGFDKFVAPTIKKEGIREFYSFQTIEKMEERLKDPLRIIFVAELNNKIVGYIEGNKTNIFRFFVRIGMHRKGIGKKLFQKLLIYIKKMGGNYVHVNASLYAVEIYKKLGFKKTTGIRTKNGVVYQPMIKNFN